MEAVILIGAQAAGKSTFYRERFADSHVRLNLDMLRTRRRLELLLRACLKAGQRFVLDNTNVTAAERGQYIALARAAHFEVTGYFFAATLADCLRRDPSRPERERVPPRGIAGTIERLELPSLAEGFSRLYAVRIAAGGDFTVEVWDGDGGADTEHEGDG